MRKTKFTKDELENIIKDCKTIADFCRKVGWQPRGDNYKTFHYYVKTFNLDTSHFTGKRTNIGNCLNKHNVLSFDTYSKGESIRTSTLMKKLLNENLKEYKCECCGITEWQGKQIRYKYTI
ncbi:MAG: hypothetical protein K2H20_00695 [Bacilli bacterium]|nr:hypothetical protein [Bacilli bacterium]